MAGNIVFDLFLNAHKTRGKVKGCGERGIRTLLVDIRQFLAIHLIKAAIGPGFSQSAPTLRKLETTKFATIVATKELYLLKYSLWQPFGFLCKGRVSKMLYLGNQ